MLLIKMLMSLKMKMMALLSTKLLQTAIFLSAVNDALEHIRPSATPFQYTLLGKQRPFHTFRTTFSAGQMWIYEAPSLIPTHPLVKWQDTAGKTTPIRVITLKDRAICSYLRNESDSCWLIKRRGVNILRGLWFIMQQRKKKEKKKGQFICQTIYENGSFW